MTDSSSPPVYLADMTDDEIELLHRLEEANR